MDVWEPLGHDAGAVGQQAADEVGGGRSGEGAKVAVQVRLVAVAAVVGELGQPGALLGAQGRCHPLEAHDPPDGLRPEADLRREAGGQVAPAPAGLRRQRAHADRAAARLEPGPRVLDLRRCAGGGAGAGQPGEERRVEQAEPRGPVRCLREPLDQPAEAAAQKALERDDLARQLGHRQAEQPACAERREVQLDAELIAGVLGDRDPVADAGRERVVADAVDQQRRSEADDHRVSPSSAPPTAASERPPTRRIRCRRARARAVPGAAGAARPPTSRVPGPSPAALYLGRRGLGSGGDADDLRAGAADAEAFARWLACFYDRVERDDLLAPVFGGRVGEEHRRHVTTWWCEVMGGPDDYTASHGGYERMLAHHRGLAITSEQRLRFVTLLSTAADEAGLPPDPEFRAAIMGYAEWGTRLAVHNSEPGAQPAPHAPVPRWGWGVAPPYLP